PNVDETRGSSELPEEYVTRLAREKARVVAGRERGAVVLAADTTVVLRGAIFEKPQTPAQAVEMLAQLAGRTHQVMTAVAVARDGRLAHAVDVTDVTFRPLSGDQIAAYVATGSRWTRRAPTRSRGGARRWRRGSAATSSASWACRSGSRSSYSSASGCPTASPGRPGSSSICLCRGSARGDRPSGVASAAGRRAPR